MPAERGGTRSEARYGMHFPAPRKRAFPLPAPREGSREGLPARARQQCCGQLARQGPSVCPLPCTLPCKRSCPYGPRPKRAVGCGTGALLRAHTSPRGLSTTARKTKPRLCKSRAWAEALGAAPAGGGGALGESLLPSQSPCRHVFEDPYRPPHLLRKAYAEKLKEGLQEKERCQSAARQRASEGPAELHLPGRAWAV